MVYHTDTSHTLCHCGWNLFTIYRETRRLRTFWQRQTNLHLWAIPQKAWANTLVSVTVLTCSLLQWKWIADWLMCSEDIKPNERYVFLLSLPNIWCTFLKSLIYTFTVISKISCLFWKEVQICLGEAPFSSWLSKILKDKIKRVSKKQNGHKYVLVCCRSQLCVQPIKKCKVRKELGERERESATCDPVE